MSLRLRGFLRRIEDNKIQVLSRCLIGCPVADPSGCLDDLLGDRFNFYIMSEHEVSGYQLQRNQTEHVL